MPFRAKAVLPVLPKPDYLVGACAAKTLSAIEDKELRKKLRNRQSALAARERKKARMIELEQKVAELEQSNKQLLNENSRLKQTLNAVLYTSASTEKKSINIDGNPGLVENATLFIDNYKLLETTGINNSTHGCNYLHCDQMNGTKISNYGKQNFGSPIDYSISSNRRKIVERTSSANDIFLHAGIKSEASPNTCIGTRSFLQTRKSKDNSCFKSYINNNFLTNTKRETTTYANEEKISYVHLKESMRTSTHSPEDVLISTPFAKRKNTSRQSLPSIEAVLNSSTKLPRLNCENYFTPAQNRAPLPLPTYSTNENIPPCKTDVTQCSSNLGVEHSQKDPYLHQANEMNSDDFKMNSLYLFAKTMNTEESFTAADISTLSDEYSKNDILQMHLTDARFEHSPLDSVSSGDSGVCADEDPLDWIPDVTIFNS